ncbi:MAG TPA: hypothetical protein VGW76_12810 [Pyrinomonadaceae bacterium]|nr:hypothetical protein [Pyrinomonadaceae bacterium]
MANHVHTVLKPLPISGVDGAQSSSGTLRGYGQGDDIAYHSLAEIMQSLKGYTVFTCNQLLGRKGQFWAHESYDHWIRDGDEWQRIISYVLNNPLKAGYVKCWKDWKWSYRRA